MSLTDLLLLAADDALGLAVFSVLKAGFVFSGKAGSGLVIARLPDGSWSAPSSAFESSSSALCVSHERQAYYESEISMACDGTSAQ